MNFKIAALLLWLLLEILKNGSSINKVLYYLWVVAMKTTETLILE